MGCSESKSKGKEVPRVNIMEEEKKASEPLKVRGSAWLRTARHEEGVACTANHTHPPTPADCNAG